MNTAATLQLGYLLRMYPRFSQTFVVNEILELERQGAHLRICSLRAPTDGVFHASIARVRARADYLPELLAAAPRRFAAALTRRWRKDRSGTWQALRQWLRHRSVSLLELAQAALVCRWAEKHDIRHLHVHFGTQEATVAMLARLMGGPTYSLTLHAFDIFRDNVDRALLAEKINHSAFTVTVCESNRRFLTQQVPGVEAAKVRVNYNGLDLTHFEPAPLEQRDPTLIFAVGRLIEKKGFVHLVRAAAELIRQGVDLRCEIAGDGPLRSQLKAEIRTLGVQDRVRLLGPLPQQQVREKLRQARVLVAPCVPAADGNIDATPTVLLEALACACPAISTRLSGIPEIIEDGTSGLLVEPGDEAALAAAIRRVLTDDALARSLAEAGRARACERFDIRHNVARLRHWLQAALGQGESDVATKRRSDEADEGAGRREQGAGAAGAAVPTFSRSRVPTFSGSHVPTHTRSCTGSPTPARCHGARRPLITLSRYHLITWRRSAAPQPRIPDRLTPC